MIGMFWTLCLNDVDKYLPPNHIILKIIAIFMVIINTSQFPVLRGQSNTRNFLKKIKCWFSLKLTYHVWK